MMCFCPQDTNIDHDVMLAKNTGHPVQVASTAFALGADGRTLVTRSNSTSSNSTGVPSAAQTAQAPLQPMSLDSAMPDSFYDELKVLKVVSDNGSTMSLTVHGWARIKTAYGSYVKLVTQPGTVRITGSQLTFADLVGGLFEEAGFDLDTSGRKLLGLYELIGLFNSIPAEDWINLGAEETAPGFFGDFYMEYVVRYPCVQPDPEFYTDRECLFNGEFVRSYNDAYAAVEVAYTAYHDGESGSTLETASNREWPEDKQVTFKSKRQEAQFQENANGKAYFCMSTALDVSSVEPETEEDAETAERVMPLLSSEKPNITRSEKMGEVVEGGRTLRHFELDLQCDVWTYMALSDDWHPEGAPPGFDGFITISYWDDKETGHPARVRYSSGVEMVVTEFLPQAVDLSAWMLPVCSTDDAEISAFKVSPYAANFQARIQEDNCDPDRDGDTSVCGKNYDAANPHVEPALEGTKRRRLMATHIDGDGHEEDYEGELSGVSTWSDAPLEARRGRDLKGLVWEMGSSLAPALIIPTCGSEHEGSKKYKPGRNCWGKTHKSSKIDIIPKKVGVTVEYWRGCGLKKISFVGKCPYGITCYGNCGGTSPALVSFIKDKGGKNKEICKMKWGFSCAIGVRASLKDILPSGITWLYRLLGSPRATLYAEMGYRHFGKIYVKGGLRVSWVKCGWGCWGVAFNVDVTVNLFTGIADPNRPIPNTDPTQYEYKQAPYVEGVLTLGGKLCVWGCINYSAPIRTPRFYLAKRKLLEVDGPITGNNDQPEYISEGKWKGFLDSPYEIYPSLDKDVHAPW